LPTPRTASVATSLALREIGFELGDRGHHTKLWLSNYITEEERSEWKTFTVVRNHWDAAVSWILKNKYYGKFGNQDNRRRFVMKIFGQIVRTLVNTAMLPVAVAKDVIEPERLFDEDEKTHTAEHIEKLKKEAGEDA
jgi:hypothetical protein